MPKRKSNECYPVAEIDFGFATELLHQLSRIADALEKLELTTNGDGEEIEADEFEEVFRG